MQIFEGERNILVSSHPDGGYLLYVFAPTIEERGTGVLTIDEIDYEIIFGLKDVTVTRGRMHLSKLVELGYDLEEEEYCMRRIRNV